jgi:hypothetical protein
VNNTELAELVTAEGGGDEPFHRWLRFKQGFSPGLVRRFLEEESPAWNRARGRHLLDPFSGSGTFVIECARKKVSALGVERLTVLTFLTNARFEREFPPLPALPEANDWRALAPYLDHPLHRAALILAEARRHTTTGRPREDAEPFNMAFATVTKWMAEDLNRPLPVPNLVVPGDARTLSHVETASVGGILTSPPYLSRHDYPRIVAPLERVFRFWYGGEHPMERVRQTDRPARTVSTNHSHFELHPAALEAVLGLDALSQFAASREVRAYFSDLYVVLRECRSVLAAGAPFWLVVGGARMKGLYVPSDLILAEMAESIGFCVESVKVARRLIPGGRKLGMLHRVTPRESVLIMEAV